MELSADLSAIAPVSTGVGSFGLAAGEAHIVRARNALVANGFEVEVLNDAYAARDRVLQLIPRGASVLTTASETLRLSGIEDAIEQSVDCDPIRLRTRSMDRNTQGADLRRLMATPDVVVGSAAAVTETGSVVIVSASGSQLPACAGGSGSAILIIGAQKIVPDLDRAFERVERYALPLETERALKVYGRPSAINKVLIIHREALGPRTRLLLLREAIGF